VNSLKVRRAVIKIKLLKKTSVKKERIKKNIIPIEMVQTFVLCVLIVINNY